VTKTRMMIIFITWVSSLPPVTNFVSMVFAYHFDCNSLGANDIRKMINVFGRIVCGADGAQTAFRLPIAISNAEILFL
jgi:hypothetical protein